MANIVRCLFLRTLSQDKVTKNMKHKFNYELY